MNDLDAARERHRPMDPLMFMGAPFKRCKCGAIGGCDASLFRDALDEAWAAYHAALAVAQEELDGAREMERQALIQQGIHEGAAIAARALADKLAEALNECHKRCEAFRSGGRGEMFPRAYDLDHAVGENNEGCTYCAALAKWEASRG